MQVTVSAVGIGARLIPSKALLDWRDIPVLKPAELLVRLRNETPIEARYVAFHARKQSPFRVRPNQGTVQPGDAVDLVVQVTCNDNVAFRDVLHILVDVRAGVDERTHTHTDVSDGCAGGRARPDPVPRDRRRHDDHQPDGPVPDRPVAPDDHAGGHVRTRVSAWGV